MCINTVDFQNISFQFTGSKLSTAIKVSETPKKSYYHVITNYTLRFKHNLAMCVIILLHSSSSICIDNINVHVWCVHF